MNDGKAMRGGTATLIGMWAFLMLVGRSRLLADPDTFWHIAIGRRICELGAVPWVDEFSYSAGGRPWVAHSWLSEVLLAWLDRAGGLDAVLWGAVLLIGWHYAWLVERWRRGGADLLLAFAGLSLVFLASSHNLLARPLLWTVVLLGRTFALLLDIDAGRRTLRSLAWLPIVCWIWANLHPGALGGLGTIGLVFAGWIGTAPFAGRSPVKSKKDVLILASVGLAAVAAVFVNPYGGELVAAWRTNLSMDLPNLIVEHARLSFSSGEGLGFLLVAAAYGVCLLTCPLARWRVTWIVPVLWGVLGASRVRHAPLFGVVAMLALADVMPHSLPGRWLVRRGFWHAAVGLGGDSGRRSWGALACAVSLFALFCVMRHATADGPLVSRWARPPAAVWPAELEGALAEQYGKEQSGLRVWNEMEFGGFLMYRFPNWRVFVDGRCELYGEPFYRRLAAARDSASACRRLRNEPAADAALVKAGGTADKDLSDDPSWRPIARSSTAACFIRAKPGGAARGVAQR